MRIYYNIFTLLAGLSLQAGLHAQTIVTVETLDGLGNGVTTVADGAISEDDYAATGILNDWEDLLTDFERTKDEPLYKSHSLKDLDAPLPRETGVVKYPKTRLYDKKGNVYDVPCLTDENGIDLFFLMTEGIHVCMVVDSPAYMQLPDDNIIKWIRYYAYTKRKRTETLFNRYRKWEKVLKDYFTQSGIPPELTELCLIESGCTYTAKSPVGALGMWQIMPETGRRFGLTINDQRDDRTDPVLATVAAAKILKANYDKIGDWTLATAAYNCGSGRIQKEMKRGRTSWETMQHHLPKETAQYIPSLIAIHYVWTYRTQLGFKE